MLSWLNSNVPACLDNMKIVDVNPAIIDVVLALEVQTQTVTPAKMGIHHTIVSVEMAAATTYIQMTLV